MKSRLFERLIAVTASLALSGCFVFDEINNGMALMEEHAAVGSAKATPPPEDEAASQSESILARLPEWKAGVTEWWNHALEEEPVPADPKDTIIRCEVAGKVRFTRKSDCAIRGGRRS